MKNLNTMDSFEKEGFKIKRNGETIVLTPEEMSDFRYLDKAIDGRNCLEFYNSSEDEQEIIEEMKKDEEICFNIEEDILGIIFNDCGGTESIVIKDYIKRNMKG